MKYLIFDVETTTYEKGNPFSQRNRLCYVGMLTHDGIYYDFPIEYGNYPYGESLTKIQELIDAHDCLVGFNTKFDLHWLIRYGLSFSNKRVYDAQVVEFVLSNQSIPYPSLHNTAISYGLEGKLDVVKTEYWDNGIDTPDIPEQILRDYLCQDVEQTYDLFMKQKERITPQQQILISLCNQDLLALVEIEQNGMKYDTETSIKLGDDIQRELDIINEEMIQILDCPQFSPGSGDHVSAALYGGILKYPDKETYIFTYKDGRTKEKTRNIIVQKEMPRLVTPLKGSELKKEGYYATNEPTLKSIRPRGKAKRLVELILKQAELEKRRGTYLHGIPKLILNKDWEENIIHGQLNQCVAITGRLSSSQPNMQNFDKKIADLFVTRY